MATSYTSLLGLALPVTGELAGTWGDTVNNSITSLLDTAVAGTTTLSTDADVTLTTTTGASNQARQAILLCSGARTALRTITAPAQSKIYVVINNTTGGFGVKLVGAGPTTGVTVAAGKTAVLVWNGSDFVEVAPATATTATNLAGGAAGSVPYQSGAGATTFLSIGANNTVMTSNGSVPGWTASTGTGSVVRASSPTLITPVLGTPTSGTLTNCTGLPISTGVSGLGANVATFLATPSSANLAAAVTDETGSGSLVFGTSPTLVTPTFTTSATFPLHIGGTGTTSTLTLRSTSGVGTTGADIIFQTGNNGATEAMRILNSGNVGIGTNNPTQLLHVVGTSTKALVTTSSSTGYASTQVQNDGATNDFEIVQYGTAATSTYFGVNRAGGAFLGASSTVLGIGTKGAQPVLFATNNAEKMRIDGSGNVGIGTNAPNVRLQVADTDATLYASTSASLAVPAGAKVSIGNASITDGTFGGLVVSATSAGGTSSVGYIGAVSKTASYSPEMVFGMRTGANSYAERMRIDSAGNVGIGTTTPGGPLDIAAAASGIVRITTTTAGASPGFYSRQSRGSLSVPAAVILNDVLGRFSCSGYGTTTYQSAGAIQVLAAETFSDTSSAGYITISTTPSGSVTSSERMRIDSAGNVGIGTASPANKLSVFVTDSAVYAPTTGFVNPIRAENQSNTTGSGAGISLFSRNASAVSGAHILASVSTSSDNNNDFVIQQRTGPTTWAERVRLTSAGFLGIGTTAAARPLHVASTGATAFFDRDGGSEATLGFRSSRGTLASPTQSLANDTLGTLGGFGYTSSGAYTTAGVAGISFLAAENLTTTARGGIITFNTVTTGTTTYTERMRIDGSGNVGIGTTTPVNKLQINGSLGRNAPVTKTVSFTLADTENWLICNGAATITVTLPAASSWTGREVMIKNIAAFTVVSASSNVVPLAGGAAGTAILAATAGKFATLVSDGTNWIIMQAN